MCRFFSIRNTAIGLSGILLSLPLLLSIHRWLNGEYDDAYMQFFHFMLIAIGLSVGYLIKSEEDEHHRNEYTPVLRI